MAEFVPVTEAKGRLSALVKTSDDEDVVLMRHGKAASVMLSARRHAEQQEHIEDLEDRLSIYENQGEPTIDADKLFAELGLDEAS